LKELETLKLISRNHRINQNKHEFYHQKKHNHVRHFIKHVTHNLKVHRKSNKRKISI